MEPQRETPERLAAIVVNHGTADDTERAVGALRASRRAVDRIIVVDNGSADDSAARLRTLTAVTVLETGRNLGFAGGTNVGIREALRDGAGLVLLVNSDARVEPDCAGTLASALVGHAGAGIAGPLLLDALAPERVTSAGIRVNLTSGRVYADGFGRRRAVVAESTRSVDAVSGAVMLLRRAVLARVGLLDEAYFFSFEDVDLCLRARQAGFATLCVPRAIAHHAGSRTIGRRSPAKLYFATRNHLRMASRLASADRRGRRLLRTASIVALNLAYAAFRTEAPRGAALAAVVRGVRDHARGRYGEGAATGTAAPVSGAAPSA